MNICWIVRVTLHLMENMCTIDVEWMAAKLISNIRRVMSSTVRCGAGARSRSHDIRSFCVLYEYVGSEVVHLLVFLANYYHTLPPLSSDPEGEGPLVEQPFGLLKKRW